MDEAHSTVLTAINDQLPAPQVVAETQPARDLPEDSTVHVRRYRLAGLALWLALIPYMLPRSIAAGGQYLNDFGGTFSSVNFPGPKVWAVPLLQRSLGGSPEFLGVTTSTATILGVLAIWLITTPAPRQPSFTAFSARWISVLGVGLMFGLLLHFGSIHRGWDATNLFLPYLGLGAELCGTVPLYLFLASEARQLGRPNLARVLFYASIVIGGLIVMAFPAVTFNSYLEAHDSDLPAQIWASGYGVVSTATAVVVLGAIFQLIPPMYRYAFPNGLSGKLKFNTAGARPVCGECGYDLRGSSGGGACPECGGRTIIYHTKDSAIAHDAHWARYVVVGLAIWLMVTPYLAYVVLIMDFRRDFGGTAPMLNFPGPKVWAVSVIQRSIGGQPWIIGTTGVFNTMLNLVAIWLITWPHAGRVKSEHLFGLRRVARWTAVCGAGAFIGFMFVDKWLYVNQPGFWKWVFAGVSLGELPGTVLMYLYLGCLFAGYRKRSEKRACWLVAVIAGGLMLMALLILPFGSVLELWKATWIEWSFAGIYGALMTGGGLLGAAMILQLAATLLPIALRGIPLPVVGSDKAAAGGRGDHAAGAQSTDIVD